jgi:hypothetical protein
LRLAAAAALCLAAGCTGPGVIKAYQGDPGSDGTATVVTSMIEQEYTVTDNLIVMVDGVRYEKTAYTAEVLPGVHRIGVQGTLRSRMQPRAQHCAFELNVEPRCTYRPTIPAYPRSAYDLKPGEDWSLTRPMTVVVECADTSYAVQVPIACASRP